MDVSDNEVPDIPTDPYWIDEANCSSYISAVGRVLGYTRRGDGPAIGLWFGFLAKTEDTPISIGVIDKEEAKKGVVAALEMSWNSIVENSKQKGKHP